MSALELAMSVALVIVGAWCLVLHVGIARLNRRIAKSERDNMVALFVSLYAMWRSNKGE